MASVNKVIIVGNLGRDPETRSFPNGDQVCNISIATTDRYKDKTSGETKEITEWHRVSFFGRLAEIAGQYLRKGSQAYVEGSLRTRKWTDKDGVERYATEIRADSLQMLGSRAAGSGDDPGYTARPPAQSNRPAPSRPTPSRTPAASAQRPNSGFDDMDDDIPF